MQKKNPGTVRIIAGEWRGRRLPVPDIEGLRPSGDRSREVLFSWLQPHLSGAVCIDLFAGTGVLGLEAASRGAGKVTLVEQSKRAAPAIRTSLTALGASSVSLVEGDALAWLEGQAPHSLDVVFLDPPFGLGLAEKALERILERDLLRPGALVYLESPRLESLQPPAGMETAKEKVLGEVRMRLLRKTASR